MIYIYDYDQGFKIGMICYVIWVISMTLIKRNTAVSGSFQLLSQVGCIGFEKWTKTCRKFLEITKDKGIYYPTEVSRGHSLSLFSSNRTYIIFLASLSRTTYVLFEDIVFVLLDLNSPRPIIDILLFQLKLWK